jgi:uncharacterized membrane protein YkvA (DUF1232 family)
LLAACIVGYAFSPIDLSADFVPVLGYPDDLILIPLGIALLLEVIPSEVTTGCREQAVVAMIGCKPMNRIAAGIIVSLRIVVAVSRPVGGT